MSDKLKVGDKVIITGTITAIGDGDHANLSLDGGVTVGLPLANLQKQTTAGKTAKQQTKKKNK